MKKKKIEDFRNYSERVLLYPFTPLNLGHVYSVGAETADF